ncbi:tRNA (adenosine(37)-N6)-threonylcarbamoyltransferase complex ATPase subunit type 1 TsaE [Desulfobacula sp.]|uniref:tRNA (adenosine(37)-N6)-threonylcarbamoyltransferase complex ATPase subunit type 1 TsaE n=1 Tax=Desulfobacula sp. TaxID=2593537 RepID=UPI002619E49C|nr:tRNA (adenosine(37)-N6)-threonylcarbamoyltransferase complex ATPase subunit type 1 TsaE [Desulfobacula sp.]
MNPLTSTSAQQTLELGEAVGKGISQGVSIALIGDLGAGKTTFVQGLAKGLGISEKTYITSPTYTLINEYPAQTLTLCHLDLYRLGSVEELEYIGFDDLVDDTHVIVVEWPGILAEISFQFDLEIRFTFDDHYNRKISVFASGQSGTNLLSRLFP